MKPTKQAPKDTMTTTETKMIPIYMAYFVGLKRELEAILDIKIGEEKMQSFLDENTTEIGDALVDIWNEWISTQGAD